MPELAPLSEPLYAAIGRMALAAAGLEWQVASCLVVIGHENSPAAETASLRSVNKNMETLRTWLASDSRIAGALKVWADKWLNDAKRAIDKRNRIVHSVMVIDGADDGEPAVYHPRSETIQLPTATDVDAITEELLRCAGVGLNYSVRLAEIVGYAEPSSGQANGK